VIGLNFTRLDDVDPRHATQGSVLLYSRQTSSPINTYSNTKMPRLDENTEQTLRDAEQGIKRRTAGAWDSFSNFALRDNVLEVAVGLM
jgi:hypothetical protein